MYITNHYRDHRLISMELNCFETYKTFYGPKSGTYVYKGGFRALLSNFFYYYIKL